MFPVMVPHKTLGDILDALFSKDVLKSWSIYQGRNGVATVKLQFTGENGSQTQHSEQVTYKQKSKKQAIRDRDRASQHRQTSSMKTRSMAKADDVKHCENDIEQPRSSYHTPPGMSQAIDYTALNSPAISVDLCNSGQSGSSSTPVSVDSSASPVLFENKADSSITDITEEEMVSTPVLPAMISNRNIANSDSDVKDLTITQDGNDSSDCEDILMNGCDSQMCAYGRASGINYDDIYKCNKCDHYYYCTKCLREGGHRKHKKHLEIYKLKDST